MACEKEPAPRAAPCLYVCMCAAPRSRTSRRPKQARAVSTPPTRCPPMRPPRRKLDNGASAEHAPRSVRTSPVGRATSPPPHASTLKTRTLALQHTSLVDVSRSRSNTPVSVSAGPSALARVTSQSKLQRIAALCKDGDLPLPSTTDKKIANG
ncbi:hypothetical protein B0H15DRAFT_871521 [Mycena belliarum]|uniref:Uncharacterized protein n=1 Tax=Mycena belliarum TaxID=1033014 RepID=A0AAD6XHY4_9AGAR|nr:hypothetical protein B0H15DRAFT_871521 [Mycena belliae]